MMRKMRKEVNHMQIIEKNISDLVPYENNPRRNEDAVQYVKASIQNFGFKVPIIVDRNNAIITGHTRLMAAKELGLETVPCIIADDLTEDQVKAFRLADNKVSEVAKWDFDALDQELADLELTDIDMNQFGFADTEAINWDDTPELTEESYQEPEKTKLQCPSCGRIAGKEFFKKV